MFGWFAPKCPVELDQKVWTEYRMRWLVDQLGADRLLKAHVIVSLEEILPADYAGRPEDARALMDRLAAHMGVAAPLDFAIATEEEMVGALGVYVPGRTPKIVLKETILNDPLQTATTLAHELSHEILLGGGLLASDEPDHEQVTDLLLIYLGIGILAANSTVKDRTWSDGQMSYFQISKSGYLTSFDFGYALALFAYVRREDKPAWTGYLRPDAGEVLQRGLKFLHAGGDTIFHPDRLRDKLRPLSVAEARDLLCDGTPTEQVFALGQLTGAPLPDAAIIETITAKLGDRRWAVVAAAADALAVLGKLADLAVAPLLRALGAGHPRVRAAAAWALGSIQGEPDNTISALTQLLDDTNALVLISTAYALGRFGDAAQASVVPLLRCIDAALFRDPTKNTVDHLMAALTAIDPDAEQRIREFYEEGNDEHRDMLLNLLRDFRQPSGDHEP